jgi:hypothetical protein
MVTDDARDAILVLISSLKAAKTETLPRKSAQERSDGNPMAVSAASQMLNLYLDAPTSSCGGRGSDPSTVDPCAESETPGPQSPFLIETTNKGPSAMPSLLIMHSRHPSSFGFDGLAVGQ